jgi:hypothetical protein
MYFILKTLITALIVAGVSEIGRRSSLMAAALASLPLTSILAFIWLYHDTGNVEKVVELSAAIFWLVIPSLLFFIVFPLLVKLGVSFWPSLLLSCVVMSGGYALMLWAYTHFSASSVSS